MTLLWHKVARETQLLLAVALGCALGCALVSRVRGEGATTGTLTLRSYQRTVGALAFSADGSLLATASESTEPDALEELIVWKVATGQPRFVRKGYQCFTHLAFSPDAALLATTDSRYGVFLWDAATGRYVAEFEGHDQGSIEALRFASDGRTLVTQGLDNTVRVWDAATRTEAPLVVRKIPAAFCRAFTADGKRAIYLSIDPPRGSILDIGAGTTRQLGFGGSDYHRLAVSADDRLLATGVSRFEDPTVTVTVWDLASRRQLAALAGHTRRVREIAFDPSGVYVASAGEDGLALVWNFRTSKEIFRAASKGVVHCVGFSPRGRALAVARDGEGVRVWDFVTARDITPPS